MARLSKNHIIRNAAYSGTLKDIMDSVKPYMDKRIKGDEAWKYPMLVITVLRRVCDRATMSAGRYDGQRPPHRIYNIECVKDGFKFQGNLIVTGLLHRDDPDDVSAFDEYDMTMSLMNVGKASNARACNAIPRGRGPIRYDDDLVEVYKPDGKLEWRGIFDDCPYKDDRVSFYDTSKGQARVDGPNGDFRILIKVSNSRVCNAFDNGSKNDDFNVGDKCRYAYHVKGADTDEVFKVVKDIDFRYVLIKRLSDGKEWKEFSSNLVHVNSRVCNSTNPIVRKAMNDKVAHIKHIVGAAKEIIIDAFSKRGLMPKDADYNYYTSLLRQNGLISDYDKGVDFIYSKIR